MTITVPLGCTILQAKLIHINVLDALFNLDLSFKISEEFFDTSEISNYLLKYTFVITAHGPHRTVELNSLFMWSM